MTKEFNAFRFHQKDNEKIVEEILNDKSVLVKWNPLTKNLAEKYRKEKYDSKLAEKSFIHIANVGCKRLSENRLDFARRMDIAKILEQRFFDLIEEQPTVDRHDRRIDTLKQQIKNTKVRKLRTQARNLVNDNVVLKTAEEPILNKEEILDALNSGPLAIKNAIGDALNSKLAKRLDNHKAKVAAETWQFEVDENCPCNNIDEDDDYDCDELDEDQLNEVRPIIFWRVSAKGKRVKKYLCPKGFKKDKGGKNCVPVGGAQKMARRVSARRGARKRKANVSGQRMATRKRLKAMRKRKQLGIKIGSRLGG